MFIRKMLSIAASITIGNCLGLQEPLQQPRPFCKSIDEWYSHFKDAPKVLEDDYPVFLTAEQFLDSLQAGASAQKRKYCSAPWITSKHSHCGEPPSNRYFFEPFVVKSIIPTRAALYIWGDIHGDIKALVKMLHRLKTRNVIDNRGIIISPDTYFIFLGDIVDRGEYSTEVLALLIQLVTKNPEHVFIIRGNHEDENLNKVGGFDDELEMKYFDTGLETIGFAHQEAQIFTQRNIFYNLLPVALFVQCSDSIIQCCHGGIEVGYDPSQLFNHEAPLSAEKIRRLSQKTTLEDWKLLPSTEAALSSLESILPHFKNLWNLSPFNVGFMWNDFSGMAGQYDKNLYSSRRGFRFGQPFTEAVLDSWSTSTKTLKAIFRGHQHNPTLPGLAMNRGFYSIFNNKVFTILSSDLFENGLSFVKIETSPQFADWVVTQISLDFEEWQEKTEKLVVWKNDLTV